MSEPSPACVMLFWLAACVPPQPGDTGARSRADSDSEGAEESHTGDTDTRDTAAAGTCADLPWKQVEFGMDVACGLHIDGCVECWGEPRGSILSGIPDVNASDIALYFDYNYDFEAEIWPAGCVVDAGRRISCWALRGYYFPMATTAEPVVDVAFGAYAALAVILADGSLVVQSEREPFPPVLGVSPPLVSADWEFVATRNGRLMIWDTLRPGLEETDLGPVDDWQYYGSCEHVLCGIRRDGSGAFYYADAWHEAFPAGSDWVAIWLAANTTLVQDAAGFVYEFDDATSTASTTPWFSEPVVSVTAVDEASCGITADGWLECTGDMKDRFPPPGSYVLPR